MTPLGNDSFFRTETIEISGKALDVGSTFAGRYQVIEELGGGGMGRVYKVFDKEIKENVALKLLNPEIASDEGTVDRFRDELKLARKISHRNVCRMYHLGEDQETRYITMEYVPGEDLKTTIRRVGQLSLAKTISIAKQVCEGLAEAHSLGVVHRDLKPQNIMVDREGNARIMDFGIARSLKAKGITREGMVIGTPDYMSPEQAEGKVIDLRSDIYSLGVVLYEMVTGRVPFEADTPLSVLLKHKSESPKNPKEVNQLVPGELSCLILRCLEKDQDRRYQKAEDLLSELGRIERRFPTTERMAIEGTERKKLKSVRDRLRLAAVLVIAGFILFGGYRLWKGLILPHPRYENLISLELMGNETQEIRKSLIEYLLLRTMTASTKLNILAQEDLVTYKRKTESTDEKPRKSVITISGEIFPKVTGLEIFISVRNKEKTRRSRKFECKGPYDLLSGQIDNIHSFISNESEGVIGKIEGERTFSQICTSNPDALGHFLKGEEAWKKLETDNAKSEYRTAIELDPEFSLAHLRLADVSLFRGDREEARESLNRALGKKDKLIEYDLLRLQALMARIEFRPIEERAYLGRLTEAFPLKKEYHYEFAESYFQVGDANEAIRHYERAFELDPHYSLAHNHIAYCHSWLGNHQAAEEHFKKYVELDNTANSYDSLAAGYMFAGKYDEAIIAIRKGTELNPTLDYLYGNLVRNFILKGLLLKAVDANNHEAQITEREVTKVNCRFYSALIEFLRGNINRSLQELKPVCDFFSTELYLSRLDESPNLPFWLRGMIAFEQRDLSAIREMTRWIERKFSGYKDGTRGEVNATNYFPVYKFYIHLKVLEACLKEDGTEALRYIGEGKRIKHKMGYWGSMFNLAYFFDEYAKVCTRLNMPTEAVELLKEAIEYNPNFASSHLSMAKIHLGNNELDKAQQEYQKALELLSDSDKDNILFKETVKTGRKLSVPVS